MIEPRPLTVWLLQTGEPLHVDSGKARPMRAMNLADALVSAGHRVVVWSSAFYHQQRRQRVHTYTSVTIGDRLEYRLVPSPGYQRNIGPGRLWDHAVLGRNLARILDREASPPDVGFIGFPPIEPAAVMARWLRNRGVPSLLDVKDQWPAIFTDPLPGVLRPVGRVALAPYFALARRAMHDATGIAAMADGMLAWALAFAGRLRGPHDTIAPLTSALEEPESESISAAHAWWDALGVRRDARPRLCFVGSQTSSFDFATVASAARSLAARDGGSPCDFVICGTGESGALWRTEAAGLSNVIFPGWIDAAQLHVLADRSAGFLAPYTDNENFASSLPNKVLDALALGLPILSPLGGEVAALLHREGVGIRYLPGSAASLISAVDRLLAHDGMRGKLSANARVLYNARFTFEAVYGGLVQHLEKLASYQANGTSDRR
jgi:glycosyltransferase involved in cell wall biosynthesis